MKKNFLLFFLISKCTFLSAQSDLLVNFTGQQIDNYNYLSFTVKSGITCSGTEVQRSIDDSLYETITTIDGVCGSDSSEQSYFVKDLAAAKNQFNYYRVHLGQFGYSYSIKLWFFDFGNAYAVITNTDGSVTVFFPNPDHQTIGFSLFNLQGQLIQSTKTNEDALNLSGYLFPSPVYFFQLRNSKEILHTGKILFHRE